MEHDWKGQMAIAIVIIGVAAAGIYWYMDSSTPTESESTQSIDSTSRFAAGENDIQAQFRCSGGQDIQAIFSDRQVHLILSDGREMTIEQAVSASGARYANADESFVFWNKGDTAFIQEEGETTYTDCVEASDS